METAGRRPFPFSPHGNNEKICPVVIDARRQIKKYTLKQMKAGVVVVHPKPSSLPQGSNRWILAQKQLGLWQPGPGFCKPSTRVEETPVGQWTYFWAARCELQGTLLGYQSEVPIPCYYFVPKTSEGFPRYHRNWTQTTFVHIAPK